jgi:hypothetical protein
MVAIVSLESGMHFAAISVDFVTKRTHVTAQFSDMILDLVT